MRSIATVGVLLFCSPTIATNNDSAEPQIVDEYVTPLNLTPPGVRLFDLHDPALTRIWTTFLATTPMLNDELLPQSLQQQLAQQVGLYKSVTAADQPVFFVATYFDILTENLLADRSQAQYEILPMRVCPVFASGAAAAVSQLLATASGLSDALFVNAPGHQERYRYLFLETEFSHCRFLSTLSAVDDIDSITGVAGISFRVGLNDFSASVRSRKELRAVVETVGEIDAVRSFRKRWPASDSPDEADVLCFIRLLSLLASDSSYGYEAIPVLFPLLSATRENSGDSAALLVVDALHLAYELRVLFQELVPFPIDNTDDLRNAKLSVMRALAADVGAELRIDTQVSSLLQQFVVGSDLLLATAVLR